MPDDELDNDEVRVPIKMSVLKVFPDDYEIYLDGVQRAILAADMMDLPRPTGFEHGLN